MGVFIFLVIAVIVIIVVVRQNKRKKAIEELKHSDAYTAAVEIKDELSRKGYEVGNLFTDFEDGSAYGFFRLSSKEKEKGENGSIYFSTNRWGLRGTEVYLRAQNAGAVGYYRGSCTAYAELAVFQAS
ncbi:hypothetical protein FACS1894124_6720 [Spirochaetia bacterium]|nr:hypothetical protein FACS1894124_6720 [Spirochaetia bacterium]